MGRGDACSPSRCGGVPAEAPELGEEGGSECLGGFATRGKASCKGKSKREKPARSWPRCMTSATADGPSGRQTHGSKKVVVPGSRAPSVKIPALVNSLPRLALKYTGKFGSFLRTFLSRKPRSRDEGTSLGPLWPIPVPYPEAFGASSAYSATWRKRRTCIQVCCLNWLYLGRPATCPPELWLGQRLSSRQWRRVKLLGELSEDGNSLMEVDAVSMARTAAKAEASSDVLDALRRAWISTTSSSTACGSGYGDGMSVTGFEECEGPWAFGDYVGTHGGTAFEVAKPIQADRIACEGSPQFDPSPFFDEATKQAYVSPLDVAHDVDWKEVPSVSVHASLEQRNLLFRRIAETGRLVPVAEHEVRPGLLSGLFAVAKDLKRDRLILDARPPNVAEAVLSKYTKTMASATCLAGIELADDEVLRMSGRDVKDFFYQFKVSSQRSKRNVLASWMEPADLEFVFGRPFAEGGYVGLNTLAMGDLNACEFAQGAHVQLLLRSGAAVSSEIMRMHQPFPRGMLSVGVVIDDLVLLEKVLASDVTDADYVSGASKRMQLVMKEYERVHLPTNPKKAFDDAELGSFWGAQVDGKKGLVRANESRTWPLVLVALRVCALGLCTVGLLRSLAGSFVSVLALRRRMLSAMNLVFDAVAAADSEKQVIRLSPELKDEIFTLCLLSSLAVVNLRARTVGGIYATDASDWGMAAVSAELPTAVAKEVQRCSLSKSTWTKLLPPSRAWLRAKQALAPEDELPDGEVFDVHPLWELLARALTYKEEWRKEHPRRVHINVGEVRAALREEARLSLQMTSVRLAFALDSQVALGALTKGRASSRALNAELLRSIPVVTAADLYSFYGYVPSKINRADGPTRASVPDEPDVELPPWWHEVAQGRFDSYDAWLAAQEALVCAPEADGLLPPPEPVDVRTGARERKATRRARKLSTETDEVLAPKSAGVLPAEAVSILCSFGKQQCMWRKGVTCFEEPGALDLYSGKAGVARSLLSAGCPWVITFEISRSSTEDLLDQGIQEKILRLLQLRAVKVCGSALVCRSFSVAITPPVRSAQYPRGVPWAPEAMRKKIKEGNAMGDFNADVHDACEEFGIWFWTANPDPSFLWRQKRYERFRQPGADTLFRLDYCRFGTPWRKRTRVATNIPKLRGLRMLCTCKKPHVRLRGQHPTRGVPWTLVAQPYPRGFCKLLASAAAEAAGWSGKFDVAACARCASQRIGEASNPGPRGRREPRGFSLEQAPVQSFASLSLGERRWAVFMEWCLSFLSCDPLQLFLQLPLMLAHAIRRHGDIEFMAVGSLMYYRHLVLAAQRKVPTLKPYVGICWDLASRWEKAEPTRHRCPVPESLVEALVSLAWCMGWKRWSGVTLLCFHGVARAGEVLRCLRKDLLLPADVLYESGAAFLLFRTSKTMHRQAARVQHVKITTPYVVKLLSLVFGGAAPHELLFHGTAQMYRKRWDYLLGLLQVPSEINITPGGLRGGGAVAFYRRGGSVADLTWVMRLRQMSTLESYLQEVAAISALTDLPAHCGFSIRSAAALYLHLAT